MADPLNSPFSLPSLPAQETEKKRKVKAKTVKGKSRKSVAPKEEGAPAIESPSWEDMNLAQSVANSPFLGTGSRDANFVEAFSANSNLNSIPSPSVFIPRVDTVSKKEAVDSLLLSKGNVGEKYWAAVSNFLNAKISKIEFESQIVSIIGKEHCKL